MKVRYTRHALVNSMPDEKITKEEVQQVIRKAELRTKISSKKFRFAYKDLEVVCVKIRDYWLVVTCYRIR